MNKKLVLFVLSISMFFISACGKPVIKVTLPDNGSANIANPNPNQGTDLHIVIFGNEITK